MTVEPCPAARTVFWIVDNGPSLAGQVSIDRLEGSYDDLRLIHLPINASWLNEIELYFSIVQRKALTPNDFDSLEALAERLLRVGDHYRQNRAPVRLDIHPHRPHPAPRQNRRSPARARPRRMTTELPDGAAAITTGVERPNRSRPDGECNAARGDSRAGAERDWVDAECSAAAREPERAEPERRHLPGAHVRLPLSYNPERARVAPTEHVAALIVV